MFDYSVILGDCLANVLMYAAVGFLLGFVAHLSLLGRGTRLGSTVQYAQYYGEQPERRGVSPGLPRAIFFAAAFPWIGFLRGACPGFLDQHLLLAVALLVCAASSGLWLLANLQFQSGIDAERQSRIEQFIAEPEAEVPAPVPASPPTWLRAWNWLNIAMFLLLMGSVGSSVLALPHTE